MLVTSIISIVLMLVAKYVMGLLAHQMLYVFGVIVFVVFCVQLWKKFGRDS